MRNTEQTPIDRTIALIYQTKKYFFQKTEQEIFYFQNTKQKTPTPIMQTLLCLYLLHSDNNISVLFEAFKEYKECQVKKFTIINIFL